MGQHLLVAVRSSRTVLHLFTHPREWSSASCAHSRAAFSDFIRSANPSPESEHDPAIDGLCLKTRPLLNM